MSASQTTGPLKFKAESISCFSKSVSGFPSPMPSASAVAFSGMEDVLMISYSPDKKFSPTRETSPAPKENAAFAQIVAAPSIFPFKTARWPKDPLFTLSLLRDGS